MSAQALDRRAVLAAGLGLAVAPRARAQGAPLVIASFPVLADFARMAAGAAVQVESLAPLGRDPHHFEPSPQQARRLTQAALVLTHGLGFDPWAERLAGDVAGPGKMVRAGEGLRSLIARPAGPDPHLWLDPALAQDYLRAIAASLAQIAPDAAPVIAIRTRFAAAAIAAAHRQAAAGYAKLAPVRPLIITAHSSFAYLARAHGLEIASPGVDAHDATPSAAAVARLARLARGRKTACFPGPDGDLRLIARIREETGAAIGGPLYADTLSTKAGAVPSYLDMIVANMQTILAAFA